MIGTATVPARYQVSTCGNCFEPIVRLRVEGLREDVQLRRLHTPNRRHCLTRWREVTDLVATPREGQPLGVSA